MKKQQFLKEEPAMQNHMRKILSAAMAALLLLGGLALPAAAKEPPLAHAALIAQMTLEEKAALVCGASFSQTSAIERLGIPSVTLADGPHGVRGGSPSVCFPTASLSACSWDAGLLRRMGGALGDSALEQGVDVILGPGLNIKRSPLCGRNFEYFSEDPYLSGILTAAVTQGIQSRNVGVSLKHFAVNNQENRRMTIDAAADERALREIYLPAFEIAVKQARPWTIMSSYNRFEGLYVNENARLQNDILRGEWGFDGLLVTDWGATRDRAAALKGGTDLEMPHSLGMGERNILAAIQDGTLSEADLDRSVDRVLTLIDRVNSGDRKPQLSQERQRALAREIAAQSIVLLKNDDSILPLEKTQKIAVIGEFAQDFRYQGAGSSQVNTENVDNPLQALKDMGANVTFAQGFRSGITPDDALLRAQAVRLAKASDVALVFAGMPEMSVAEGVDRSDLELPAKQNRLVEAVAKANPNTVVVYCGGSVVKLPWLDSVKAFVCTYLAGEAGGAALADILLGAVNPSGKLAETWPLAEQDLPCAAWFPGYPKSAEYRESIFVGYRYFDTFRQPVQFDFGYGLSYTSFAYSNLKINGNTVTCKIKNVGSVAGAEIVQLYVSDVESTAFRPAKELKGFAKVWLRPGEAKTVSFKLDERSFAFYNTKTDSWCIEAGDFEILVGASSQDIRLQTRIYKSGTSASEIPDLRAAAPACYGLQGQSPADVPQAQFEALLGRPLPPRDLARGAVIANSDSLDDAIRQRPLLGAFYKCIFLPLLSTVTVVIPYGSYVNYILEVPLFWLTPMTRGFLDEALQMGVIKLFNGDWSGLWDVLGWLPRVLANG